MSLRILAEGVVGLGHRATVVSLNPDGHATTGEIGGVRTRTVALANVYWPHGPNRPRLLRPLFQAIDAYNPVMGHRLGRILDQEQPDVVHAHNLQGFSVAAWHAAARRGIPIVQTLHDYYLGCPRSAMFKRRRNCAAACVECRLMAMPRRRLSHLPHTVTAVSARMLSRLTAAGLFAAGPRLTVIRGNNPDGITPRARPDPPPGTALVFGFIGRLDVLKGVELLIAAFNRLPPGSARLEIAGTGAPVVEARLRALATAPGITFLGQVEPGAFYAGIDCLIVPSVWEDPLPRVVHEAQGHGVPVIGAALGGIPEMITPEQTGFLFPGGDGAALEALMRRLLQDGLPAARLAEACAATAGRYTFALIRDQYLRVLQDAAATRSRPEPADHPAPATS